MKQHRHMKLSEAILDGCKTHGEHHGDYCDTWPYCTKTDAIGAAYHAVTGSDPYPDWLSDGRVERIVKRCTGADDILQSEVCRRSDGDHDGRKWTRQEIAAWLQQANR